CHRSHCSGCCAKEQEAPAMKPYFLPLAGTLLLCACGQQQSTTPTAPQDLSGLEARVAAVTGKVYDAPVEPGFPTGTTMPAAHDAHAQQERSSNQADVTSTRGMRKITYTNKEFVQPMALLRLQACWNIKTYANGAWHVDE